jgi:hypothetical protein
MMILLSVIYEKRNATETKKQGDKRLRSNSDFKKTYGAERRLIAKSAGVDGLVSMKEISFHAQGCTAVLGVTFVSRKNRGPPPGGPYRLYTSMIAKMRVKDMKRQAPRM